MPKEIQNTLSDKTNSRKLHLSYENRGLETTLFRKKRYFTLIKHGF